MYFKHSLGMYQNHQQFPCLVLQLHGSIEVCVVQFGKVEFIIILCGDGIVRSAVLGGTLCVD